MSGPDTRLGEKTSLEKEIAYYSVRKKELAYRADFILENEFLRVELIDPNGDALHLFSRFNHCGYIKSVFDKKQRRQLLSSAQAEFHPFHGEGFPDEFEMPVGYDEAEENGLFLKLGVGLEIKKTFIPYTNWDMHKIAETAKTSVFVGRNKITFTQSTAYNGYAYEYEKTISLDGSEISISHNLRNTCEKDLLTLWYSHAFLPIEKGNEKLILELPEGYEIYNNGGLLRGNSTRMEIPQTAEILKGTCFNWRVTNNTKNKQVLYDGKNVYYQAEGDFSIHELQVYINERIISVEPKLNIFCGPKNVKKWATKYLLRRD